MHHPIYIVDLSTKLPESSEYFGIIGFRVFGTAKLTVNGR